MTEVYFLKVSPSSFKATVDLFGAAIGSIEISALKIWQSRGGFIRTYGLGDNGTDVRLIQKALSTDPSLYPKGAVTGYFGSATRAAIGRFQDQNGLSRSEFLDQSTIAFFNKIFYNQLCPKNDDFQSDLSLVHISRSNGISPLYIPTDLVDISGIIPTIGIICVKKTIIDSLSTMLNAALTADIPLKVCSGYRGPDIQNYLVKAYLTVEGPHALEEVARPGYSEHQLGTTVDLTSPEIECTDDSFSNSQQSVWLKKNAWRFGFTMSYPEMNVDGSRVAYNYEPWHWRYVGIAIATELYEKGISYNEYLNLKKASSTLSSESLIHW